MRKTGALKKHVVQDVVHAMRMFGWSIHKESKHLDRAGEVKESTFDFISMEDPVSPAEVPLLQDNVVLAAGEPWAWRWPSQCPVSQSAQPKQNALRL